MSGAVRQFVDAQKQVSRETGRRFRVRRPMRQQLPRHIERSYGRDLTSIITKISDDINEQLIPQVGWIVRSSSVRGDDYKSDIVDVSSTVKTILGDITLRLNNQHLRTLEESIRQYHDETSTINRMQLVRQIRRMLEIDAFPTDPAARVMLQAYIDENVSLIKSITGDYVEQVGNIVRRGVVEGERPESIEKKIRERFKVTKTKALFIARDQVNKLNGALTHVRQVNLGIDEYIFRTSLDERVRNSHLELEGTIQKWDSPPPGVGHPGQDFGCRCNAEPYIREEPPPAEDRFKIIREVKAKRVRLRETLKNRKARRLIARD